MSVDATGSGIDLLNGTKYWVYAIPVDPNGVPFWNLANSGIAPRLFNGSYADATQAAYSVQVNLVPEPASMDVLGLGALALHRRRRRG